MPETHASDFLERAAAYFAAQGITVRGQADVPPALWAYMRERGIAATRQLAKRQITWLRSMPQRRAIACDAPDALQQWLNAATVALPQVTISG